MTNNISDKLIDKYKFVMKLGKGSFGSVYKAVGMSDGKMYACKVENKRSSNHRLRGEYAIYKRFEHRNIKCVPVVYEYFDTPKHYIMVMELLGKSLDDLMEEAESKLDIPTVFKIALALFVGIEEIHKAGIIHRDIKPNNFMFGTDKKQDILHIMDFGLSKKWYERGKHIAYKSGRSMIGTPRYASINVHMGIEPSRRDDMESIGYMLVYLAKGTLPWQGLKKKTKLNPIDKIYEKKTMISVETLCADLPSCFTAYLNFVKKMEFDERPNYSHFIALFSQNSAPNQ